MTYRDETGWDSYWGDWVNDWEAEPEFELPGEDGTIFPWEDVAEAKAKPVLQSNYRAGVARRYWGHKVACPRCGRGGHSLTWLYVRSPMWTWVELCGRAGYMAVCERCRVQVVFYCTLLN
jgi:hypothetical protein